MLDELQAGDYDEETNRDYGAEKKPKRLAWKKRLYAGKEPPAYRKQIERAAGID